ncbi:hypothetical protein DV736_g1174, partial [Chaetothyriales sp. CBS 134916]
MLLNSSTTVHIHTHSPTSLILTPYLPVHVRRYHAWMQDPHIRELTASDPLTLDEEYAMQRSWRSNYDKLTFIVYSYGGGYETRTDIDKRNRQLSEKGMVGDVNLFLFLDDDDDNNDVGNNDGHAVNDTNNININDNGNDDGSHDRNNKIVIGELELMLAEPSARGRGLGSAVLLALLMYVVKHEREIVAGFLSDGYDGEGEGRNKRICKERGGDGGERKGKKNTKIEHFRVRIAKDNIRSLKLFEGLGFKRTSAEPNYFGEIEMRRYPSTARGWQEDVQEMMREKRLDGWEERQMDLVE